MHHRVNDCLYVLMNFYEYAKMLNEFSKNEIECQFIKMNVFYFTVMKLVISKGFDIHRQVKINDNNERRFGVVMTPFSSSKMKRINCQKKFA